MKKLFYSACLCLISAVALAFVFHSQSTGPTVDAAAHHDTIALLTDQETGTFYMQLKNGMTDMGNHMNANLTSIILDAHYGQQLSRLADEDISSTVVVYITDDGLCTDVINALHQQHIRVIVIGRENGDYAIVQDMQSDARTIISHIREAGYSRLLFMRNDCHPLERAIKAAWNGTIEYADSPGDIVNYPGSCLISFSQAGTENILAARSRQVCDVFLIAMDTGVNRVPDLESGFIQGMLIPSPYEIGCLAMTTAHAIQTGSTAESVISYSSCFITPENMYDAQYVGAVFPLLW